MELATDQPNGFELVKMPILTRKLIRDLWRARWQYSAVAAMILLGVTFFNAAYSAYVNLRGSYDNSYAQLRFEDFGIRFNDAPSRAVERIRRLDGVSAAEGRLVEEVAVELPGKVTKKLIGRLIGIPYDRPLKVDALKLVQGRYLHRATSREVLLEAAFAKYHHLKPGDSIDAVRGTSRATFRIAGIVQSAEYLYVVRSKQQLMPYPDIFGVMFVSNEVLGPLVGKPDRINEVKATIDAPERLDSVMRQAKLAMSVYRPDDAVSRKDQPSSQLLEQDVASFRAYAVLFPLLFLSVAALSVYTLLMRMVYQQRPIIGLLRSLGFGSLTVVTHYLAASIMVGFVSSLAGTATGLWMANAISRLYMSQLQVPYEQIVPRWNVAFEGILIGTIVCAFAGVLPARVAARIRPAEAMRPVMPSYGRSSLQLDRLFPNLRLLWRIPLRNVTRQPKRTLSTIFGIVAGACLLMTAKGLLDTMDVGVAQMIGGTFRQDLSLTFTRSQSHGTVERVRNWPGVTRVEGFLDVPVEMEHQGITYSALVTGLEPDQLSHQLKDSSGARVAIPRDGALFGPTLRRRLHLEVGDTVTLRLPDEMAKETPSPRTVRVAGFIDEAIGTQAYVMLGQLQKLFRKDLELPPNAVSGMSVKCEPAYLASTRERLLKLSDAGSVISLPDMRVLIEEMMKTVRRFVWIMEIFGAALAFAIVFNMVTINVLEREAEVATLRTIGVGRRQIAAAIILENVLVALLGLLVGLPIGRLFVELFWQAAQTSEQQDLMTLKMVVKPETYLLTALIILAVALLSQIPSLRYVSRLDLAKATKERSS